MKEFSLEEYLTNGINNTINGIIKASLTHPKASLFMVQHALDSKKAKRLRESSLALGEHIPPFLIASITNKCNLHCKGCYARANNSCGDNVNIKPIMTAENWDTIFTQAEDLGIEFILLAGGEPFVRKDVLAIAAEHNKIIFPIFTNGTMLDDTYLGLLDQSRNLMPVLSIEGNQNTTDERRGLGVYQKLLKSMNTLHSKGILFGASVTVTKNNMDEVLSDNFITGLDNSGAKAIIYVEYVPVDNNSKSLALDDNDRTIMDNKLAVLRIKYSKILMISFPGDEKASGGCLAAGRGFFHINAYGGAEPCPFSPYSDTNVLSVSLRKALHSPLFIKLQENESMTKEHIGGCVLFEQKTQVEAFLMEEKSDNKRKYCR